MSSAGLDMSKTISAALAGGVSMPSALHVTELVVQSTAASVTAVPLVSLSSLPNAGFISLQCPHHGA